MSMRAWVVFGLGLSALGATPVSADILPPDSAAETCTVDLRQTDGSECLNCWGWQDYPYRCSNLLAPYCFIKVCQTSHARSWAEVLCRAKVADAPPVPTDVGSAIYSPSPWSSPADADGGLLAIPATCAPYTPQTTPVTTTATATSTQSATSPPTSTTTQSATQSTPGTQTSTTSSTDTTTTKSQGCASCSLSADKSAIGELGALSPTVVAAMLVALRRRRRR